MDAKINGSFDALLAETSFYLNYMKRRYVSAKVHI